MPFTNQIMSFESGAFAGELDKFLVKSIKCTESLSRLFRIEVVLLAVLPPPLAEDVDIDLTDMLQESATLRILKNTGDINDPDDWREVKGELTRFEQLDEASPGWGRFRAVLVPKLWRATRTKRSRIFAEKTIEELIPEVLTKNTTNILADEEYEVTLIRAASAGDGSDRDIYPKHENLAQYEESDWQFLSRHLENEGVFFFFDNDGTDEKVLFADDPTHYLSPAIVVNYQPKSVGDAEVVSTFVGAALSVPAKIAVRQYIWSESEPTTLTGESPIIDGTGERSLFNESFLTQGQGNELAKLRKEGIQSRQNVFRGTSNARSFRPGKTVTLNGHYRGDFDKTYVLTDVVHVATQTIQTTGTTSADVTISGVTYKNTFKAIPSSVAYRPKRTTKKPRIEGLATGKVVSDSADNRYAQLDEYGRYLVTMEYDTNAEEAKVKRLVRMSQPSSGPSSGIHFPINPGAEVVLAHIDGDPDRPIIVGSVPNPANESPTNENNVSANAIQTRSGNLLQIDDDAGAAGFLTMDASRSRVTDHRRRGIADPLDSFFACLSSLSGGQGGAQLQPGQPQRAQPQPAGDDATSGPSDPKPATPAPRLPRSDVPTSGSGSVSCVPSGTVPSLASAWRLFFDGDALEELGSSGPYRNGGGGMEVSKVDAVESTALSEANIRKLLNYAIRNTGAADSLDAKASDSDSPDLTGKVADLILNKAQNFEGSAAGSTVSVDIGDKVIYSLGDTFHYGDGSNSIRIGTGGYTRNETLATGTTEEITHGKQTTTTTHHGWQSETTRINGPCSAHTDKYDTDTSFTYRGGATATCQINLSVQTNTEMFLGAYNCNTVNVGAFLDTTIFLIGKIEIEISAAILLTIKLGKCAEFEMDNSRACLNSAEVFLNNMQGALKVTEAALRKDEAALAALQAALDKKTAAVNSVGAAVMMGEASVSAQAAYVTEKTAAIAADQAALTQKSVALSGSQTALSDMQTAAFHSMQ